MKTLFVKTYLVKYYPKARLSPKYLSKLVYNLGLKEAERLSLMRELLKKSEYLAVDMTFIFSESKLIKWLEPGYNSKHIYHKQLNVLLAFSLTTKEPAYIRVLPGSIRDVSTIERLVKDVPDDVELIMITDKGFYSGDNVGLLENNAIFYVIPLRRDLKIIQYPESYENYFKFRDRNVMYHSYKLDEKKKVIIYFDPKLMGEEENTYLDLITTGTRDLEGFQARKGWFGTLAVLTKLEKSADEVYSFYKQRGDIEEVFDVMKNVLNADRSYLRTEEHMRGYMFIILLSLIIHYRLLNKLRGAELINVISVKEFLIHLSKIYVVEDNVGSELFSEVPKKARLLLEKTGVDLLRNSGHQ